MSLSEADRDGFQAIFHVAGALVYKGLTCRNRHAKIIILLMLQMSAFPTNFPINNMPSLTFHDHLAPSKDTPFTQKFFSQLTFGDLRNIRLPRVLPMGALSCLPSFSRDRVDEAEFAELSPKDYVLQDKALLFINSKLLKSKFEAGYRSIIVKFSVPDVQGVVTKKLPFSAVCHFYSKNLLN